MLKKISFSLLLAAIFSIGTSFAATPVERHGQLSIAGTNIVNENGNIVQLRGMSMFWSQHSDEWWNQSVVDALVDDWKITVLRLAMGVEEGGYEDAEFFNQTLVEEMIEFAVAKGIYVIIDWHDHYAHTKTSTARGFFREMAQTYGHLPNIIYEIYNEPVNVGWPQVKSYAESVISEIRDYDENNIIVVGTPNWSQDVDQASYSPINEDNIAYTLHFYAASHKGDLRGKAETAIRNGLALFVTEWGTTEYSGDGYVDLNESQTWMDFMDDHKISWCNWSVFDKNETSAAFKSSAHADGNWTSSDYTQSGAWVRSKLRSYDGDDTYGEGSSSSGGSSGSGSSSNSGGETIAEGESFKIEAESFSDMSGIQTEYTSDGGSSLHIAFIEDGDWVKYRVEAPVHGVYTLDIRFASAHPGGSGGTIGVYSDNKKVGSVAMGVTGGWQAYDTKSVDIELTRGVQTVEFRFTGPDDQGLMNINWIEFTLKASLEPIESVLKGGEEFGVHLAGNHLHVQTTEGFHNATYSVFALDGAILQSGTVNNGNNAVLDLSALERGRYFVRIQSGSGFTMVPVSLF